MPSVEIRGRIRWADADSAGRLYFPRIFDYVSEAEAELLRGAGFPRELLGRPFEFPRVHVECRFHRILRLDAPFRLVLRAGHLGRTSIGYDFQVFRDDDAGELAAEGRVTVVVTRDGAPVEIPPELRAALGVP
jgi:acyl-CoA thioester hydrolase